MFGEEPGSLWPAEDDQAREVREVYARVGLAMYKIQVLEHGVVNAIVALTLFKDRDKYPVEQQWWDAIDLCFQNTLAQTFGNLLKRLTQIPGVGSDLIDRLRLAKEPRDILVHRFFRLHAEDFLHPAGRRKMIIWCEDQIKSFYELDVSLEQAYADSLATAGVTKEWLSQRLDEELAKQGVTPDVRLFR